LVDWAEIGIITVSQFSIVPERFTYNSVLAGLIGEALGVFSGPIPISPVSLVGGLAELELGLSIYTVVGNIVAGDAVFPLRNRIMIASDPFL